jgi:hypothetical protein
MVHPIFIDFFLSVWKSEVIAGQKCGGYFRFGEDRLRILNLALPYPDRSILKKPMVVLRISA